MAAVLIILGLALIAADWARAGQDPVIYRCENAGVIEFSDQPCLGDSGATSEQAQRIHQSSGSVSVISPPDDLDDIQQASRNWLEDYRARQMARETARAESRPERATPPRVLHEPLEQGTIVRPLIWPYRPPHYFYRSTHRPGNGVPPTRQQPYSALSGPFPGTRRRDLEPAAPPKQ